MNTCKARVLGLLIVWGCTATHQASAQGIPTFDAANFAQAINQVLAWQQQYNQMLQQAQQYQTQIQQMSGARALGSILNNPSIESALADEFKDSSLVLNAIRSANVSSQLPGVLSAYGIQTPTRPEEGTGVVSNSAAAAMITNKSVADAEKLRQSTNLSTMATRIDNTADAKESLDLLNRNVLEVARINSKTLQVLADMEAGKEAARLREIADTQQQATAFADRVRTKTDAFKAAYGY